MTKDTNLNALWSRAIAEELARAGCAGVVLCPGSRNSPLLFALAAQFGDMAWSCIDERAAAFAALGAIKASGKAMAVCVTSGTAVAEGLPAMCEAGAMGLPLILLAADRPWEMQDRGAAQTMSQRGMFVGHAAEVVLGEPIAANAAVIALRAAVSRATQSRQPTVMHVPFRDPLPPLPDAGFHAQDLSELAQRGRVHRPFTTVGPQVGLLPPRTQDGEESVADGFEFLRPGLKGLIIVGATGAAASPFPAALAQATGFPVLADVTSGQRGLAPNHEVILGDALIAGPAQGWEPEVIIRIGPTPLHRGMWEWLGQQTCPVLAIEDPARNQDFLGTAWARVEALHPAAWQDLGERLAPGDSAWCEQWLTADRQAQKKLHAWIRAESWSEPLAAHIAVNHDGFSSLHVAASMPVRHAHWHLFSRLETAGHRVFANRGVNGIDGIIATFAGAMRAQPGRGLLLIGDIACLHDLSSLELAARWAQGCAIVVLNNDGGGIFDHLPVSRVPGYERLIRTPHGRDFSAAAAHAGLAYAAVSSRAALETALTEACAATAATRATLIECELRGAANQARHQDLMQALVS